MEQQVLICVCACLGPCKDNSQKFVDYDFVVTEGLISQKKVKKVVLLGSKLRIFGFSTIHLIEHKLPYSETIFLVVSFGGRYTKFCKHREEIHMYVRDSCH